jgi:hypothetical protein
MALVRHQSITTRTSKLSCIQDNGWIPLDPDHVEHLLNKFFGDNGKQSHLSDGQGTFYGDRVKGFVWHLTRGHPQLLPIFDKVRNQKWKNFTLPLENAKKLGFSGRHIRGWLSKKNGVYEWIVLVLIILCTGEVASKDQEACNALFYS